MPITSDTLAQVTQMRHDVDQIIDDRTRDLTQQWTTSWDDIAPLLAAALYELASTRGDGAWPSRGQIARSTSAQAALGATQARLDDLAAATASGASNDAATGATVVGQAQANIIASQLPPSDLRATMALTWGRVDPLAIAAITARAGQQITSLTNPLPGIVMTRIRGELIRGVTIGDNPRTAARRMLTGLENEFNGGLTRALTIARTEMLDATREAARLAQRAAGDVVTGWMWLASLDRRCCSICWIQHGTVYPLDQPGPWDHPNGRCTRTPVVRPWNELGFSGLSEPPSLVPNAEQTFRSLPRDEQLRIMGPSRLAALDSGTPWGDLAYQRTNPGWRDSYALVPVRDLTRRTP